jgi:hypothetical protein
LVVGVTCIGAFIGQVDASIVQLALPTLQLTVLVVFALAAALISWLRPQAEP